VWEQVSALAPLVEVCAQEGDEVAAQLMSDTINSLLDAIRTCVQRAHVAESGVPWTLVLAGGVLVRGGVLSVYGSRLAMEIEKIFPNVNVVCGKITAAHAAALIAQKKTITI
jgi:N-acetylglucosamine kinase-like BadF-type ATPase